MATLIVLKNKVTGEKKALYSVDAREVLKDPNGEWEFDRRLGRSAKIVEAEIAAGKPQNAEDGAMEFQGERAEQESAKKSVSQSSANAVSGQDVPQAPRGSRGGGKQEPAKADTDDK